jgi:hypothetical protein
VDAAGRLAKRDADVVGLQNMAGAQSDPTCTSETHGWPGGQIAMIGGFQLVEHIEPSGPHWFEE